MAFLPGWLGRSPAMSDPNLRRRRGAQQPDLSAHGAKRGPTGKRILAAPVY